MSQTNQEKLYEVKKVGKFWLIGRSGERLKRHPLLTKFKEIELSDNFLIAGDVIFEIKDDECGKITLMKIEDVPDSEEMQDTNMGANHKLEEVSRTKDITASEKGKLPLCEQKRNETNTEGATKCDDEQRRENKSRGHNTDITLINNQTLKSSQLQVESKDKNVFPVPIIYENESSDESEELSNITTSETSTIHTMMTIHTGEEDDEHHISEKQGVAKSLTKDLDLVTDRINKDTDEELKSDYQQTEQTEDDRHSLETGQTEDDFNSLEAGQTEETALIETTFVNNMATAIQGKADNRGNNTEEIKLINKLVWNIISVRHSVELNKIEEKFQEIRYDSNCVSVFATSTEGLENSELVLRDLRSFIEKYNNKEYEEVSVESADIVLAWCYEIEHTLGYECCMYIPAEQKVAIYCDTYEGCMQVKHLLLLRSGRIKSTSIQRRKQGRSENVIVGLENSSQQSSEHSYEYDKNQRTSISTPFKAVNNDSCKSGEEMVPLARNERNDFNFKTKENIKVFIYNADLLQVKVDCIVSASNEHLVHGGGISNAIAKAAGSDLTREGNEYIKRNGPIPVGNVCTTTAGKLPYQFVIHAVGPVWSNFSPYTEESIQQCETDLYNALYNSFLEAAKRGARSIAFPAVSSAIFGVPENLCVHIYTKAILEFSKANKAFECKLNEIHFVDKNTNLLQHVSNTFKAAIKAGSVPKYDRRNLLSAKSTLLKSTPKTEVTSKNPQAKFVGNADFAWEKDAKHVQVFTTPENLNVYVYEASILKVPVDCIVNAANDALQHGGGVAAVISRAAGQKLSDECYQYIKRHGKLPVGQTCATTAGNLPYRCVIHAPGPGWCDFYPHGISDIVKCEHFLYTVLYNSFVQADRRGLRSIALPAISSAIFGVPVTVCVNQYVKATIDYSKQLKKSGRSLQEIHFVDINPTIVQKIQEAFHITLVQKKPYPYDRQNYVRKVKDMRLTKDPL